MITKSVIRPSTTGGGSGGVKLPRNILHLSGGIKDEAVDWEAGATCIAVLEMNVDSTDVTEDTQISGGLYATATGLEFTDGTNTATYACTWSAGDTLSAVLSVTSEGKMKLGISFAIDYFSYLLDGVSAGTSYTVNSITERAAARVN